ncbi:hypothetical protein D3C72_1505140 [compost metagenome]
MHLTQALKDHVRRCTLQAMPRLANVLEIVEHGHIRTGADQRLAFARLDRGDQISRNHQLPGFVDGQRLGQLGALLGHRAGRPCPRRCRCSFAIRLAALGRLILLPGLLGTHHTQRGRSCCRGGIGRLFLCGAFFGRCFGLGGGFSCAHDSLRG